jgi:hypothetical protein
MLLRKKGWVILVVLAVVLAFGLPAFAAEKSKGTAEKIKGTLEAVDMKAKKVKLNGTEYKLGGETAEADLEVGDEIEGSADKGVLKSIDSITRKLSG